MSHAERPEGARSDRPAKPTPPRKREQRRYAQRSGVVVRTTVDPRALERSIVARHPCPACKAEPGAPCIGRRGPRRSHHMSRVMVAAGPDRLA